MPLLPVTGDGQVYTVIKWSEKGAGFVETQAPKNFIKVNRPTDADADGMSRVYQASWNGPASFNWAGPEHGFVVQVKPKDYTPEPLPDFEKLSDHELITLFESPSPGPGHFSPAYFTSKA